ncbi:plantaricin C family lantibiotic [Nocardiopsis suaedae]|uniref:Plantaricin C family lantibiotic n=1 Tax=Nocardiopsis suaedae TaxID=3018444 RepID=A0ABT4TGK4_9ACTN|nr:plantaricin C family lantibiotic [Nocardiopsis suaedae]MDA2803852.1 plantaricin C family lantibiotic [Nocardiopsis suaedae]
MTNPNAGILEEIGEQGLAQIAFGADAHPNPITFPSCATPSIILGNQGKVCTLTVECQDGC